MNQTDKNVLQYSNHLLKIIENFPEPISVVEKDYRYGFVNQAYSELLDMPLSQIKGAKVEHVLGKKNFDENVGKNLEKAFKGETVKFRNKLLRPELDIELLFEVTYLPERNESGEIDHVVCIAHNVSRELELQKKWQKTINSIDDTFFLISDDYEIEDINQRGLELLNKSREDVIGKKCFNVIHGTDKPEAFCPLKKCRKTGQTQIAEHFENRLNKHFLIKTSPIRNEKGQIERYVDLMQDITYSKELEKELKISNEEYLASNEELRVINEEFESLNEEYTQTIDKLNHINEEYKKLNEDLLSSEQKLRLITESVSDFVVEWDISTGELRWQSKFKKLAGYRKKEINHIDKLLELVHPEDKVSFQDHLQKLWRKGSDKLSSFRLINSDGKIVYVRSNAKVLYDESSKPWKVLGSLLDISREKEVELELVEQHRFQGTLLENLPGGMLLIDNNYVIRDVNPQLCRITGYKKEELVGQLCDIVCPKGSGSKECPVWEDGELGFEGMDTTIKCKDGSKTPILKNAKRVTIDGQPHVLELFQDNTELKEAEVTIKNSEERYKALYNNAPLAYQSLDEDGYIIDVNPMWLRVLGYERSEVIGKWFGDFLDEDYKKHFLTNFPVFKQDGQISDVQFKMNKKSGSHIFVSFEGRVGYFENGSFKQTYCTFQDITDQRAAQLALVESEEKFRIVAETSPSAIMLYQDDKWVFVNKAASRISGYSNKQLKQMQFWDFVHPDFQQQVKELGQARQAGLDAKKSYEFKIIRKSGEERWVSLNGSTAVYNQKSAGIVSVIDITDRKRAELELQNKNQEYSALNEELNQTIQQVQQANDELEVARLKAEESDKLKSAFLANMSHEIRTPMNGILGFASLLKDTRPDPENMAKYIDIIEKSGHRMLNIINDLIDISKVESGQMEVYSNEFCIDALLDELYLFFSPEAENKGLELICNAYGNSTVKLLTDKEKLNAVFTNLVKNAIKYTEQGSIEFGYQLKGKKLHGFVKDTGIGISQENLENVFERFVQEDLSLSKPYEGAGLGLAITKAYVELMGGKISVSSKLHEGSVFSFHIPIDLTQIDDCSDEASINEPKEAENPALSNLNILVAEDEETSFWYLEELLGGVVNELVHVSTGRQAVEMLKNDRRFHLVLMDVKMPDMDGLTATALIREFNQEIVVVAQTAYALAGDREKALDAGCNEYMSKPLNKEILFELLEQFAGEL